MFLWIIWLFEGFSGSNLMLLSTFPIQKSLYYYTYVLKESISDGKIIKEYENFAVRAYEGVACCNSCDNEYTWELSSDILEKYRDYFVSHQ